MELDPETVYNASFFRARSVGSVDSARVVVPLTLQLVRGVSSVVDIGCGAGEWLCVFKENGVQRVLGLDAGAAQNSGQLKVKAEEFRSANLQQPLQVTERYDLCICLEVAEHLTEDAAPNFVRNLCDLSDIVLFSAAIPGQRGRGHINERWPSYWARYFDSYEYRPFDIVRGPLWNDTRVEIWYRQNIVIFSNKSGESRLSEACTKTGVCTPFDVVHPELFDERMVELKNIVTERERRLNLSLSQAQLERRRAEKKLEDVLSSTSWRVTKPFRRLSGSMRGFLQAVSWK